MPPMDMPPTRAAAAALLLVCTVSPLACTRRDAPLREPQRETAVSTQPVAAPDSFLVALTTSRGPVARSEEHTSELQSHSDLVCRLLLEKKKKIEIIKIPFPHYEQLMFTT